MSAFNDFIDNVLQYFKKADDPIAEHQLELLGRINWTDFDVRQRTNRHGETVAAEVWLGGIHVGEAYGSQFILAPKARKDITFRGMQQDISDLLYR